MKPPKIEFEFTDEDLTSGGGNAFLGLLSFT